jgi:MFS family permease
MVAVLAAVTVVAQVGTDQLFGLLVLPLQATTDSSRAAVSAVYSIGYAVRGVMVLGSGRLADRYGPRPLIVVGALLGAACLLGLTRASALWQAYLLWGLGIGVVMSLTVNEVPFTAITNWFQRRRGAALGTMAAITGLGGPLYLPLAGLLVARVGWRSAVALSAALFLIVAPMAARYLRRRPEDLGLEPDGAQPRAGSIASGTSGATLAEATRHLSLWTLLVSAVCANFAFGILFVHQVPYLVGRGYSPVVAGEVVGALGLVSVPGRLAFNLLSDRWRPQWLLAIAHVAQACGPAILAILPSAPFLLLYVGVYGLAFGAIGPLRAAALGDHFGRRAYGSIVALLALPSYWAIALGSALAGWLFDVFHGYEFVFFISVGLAAFAAVAVLVTPRPTPRAFSPDPEPTPSPVM